MIHYIDWLMMRSYFKAYLVCLVSLFSLYIVVDLFTNLDEFTGNQKGLVHVLVHIGTYYGYLSTRIFDQLCEPIVLLAAMFTVAWMQRNNELLPLLSAGVSTRRVILPVLISAWIMLSLATVNSEMVIPRIANKLSYEKNDPEGQREIQARGAYDPNGIQIDGGMARRQGQIVRPLNVLIPSGVGRNMVHVAAAEARYIPPGAAAGRSGGWLLTGAQPPVLEDWENRSILEPIDPGKYFLYTKEVDFDLLTRNPKWFQLASTRNLYRELQRPDANRLTQLAVIFHMRLTRPLLGMILVCMGLSLILTDQNRNVFISAGLCLVLCGVFFGCIFGSRQLGEADILAPALAAWLPVLTFGPLAFVMFDAVHT